MLKNTPVTHVSEHLLPMSPVYTAPQGARPLTPIGHFARFAVKLAIKFSDTLVYLLCLSKYQKST